jgi:phosphatidylinositol alpha-1,6-mannosyltransferase
MQNAPPPLSGGTKIRPPRVLLVAKAYLPNLGGIETYSDEVARAYLALGRRVTVLTQFRGPRGVARRGKLVVINVGEARQAVVGARMWAVLKRLLRKPVSLIHCTSWRVAMPVVARRRKEPVVVTVHGREITMPGPLMRTLMRRTLARVDRIAAISRTTAEALARLVPECRRAMAVSWNGLTYASQAKELTPQVRQVGPVNILTFCRLVERKNVEGAIRALRIVLDQGGSECRLSVAGNGPERPRLEALVDELNLRSHVTFLGFVDDADVVDLYRNTDIFLHPQIQVADARDFEGFCLTIVDAMSLGVPVIAGTAGAPSEYVDEGVNGLLVDGRDTPQIAAAIIRLAESRELRSRIARQGRAWALANLDWRRHVLGAIPESCRPRDVPAAWLAPPVAAVAMPHESGSNHDAPLPVASSPTGPLGPVSNPISI